jgi:pyruvate dehydrogenase E2 component (dihydrolipoamide acetyltransferase)
MAETVTMPKLGFDMQEGTFVNWVKKVGDQVKSGDVIAEIETDKATVEVEAYANGVLKKTLVNPGDVVAVGAPIAIIGSPDEKIEGDQGGAPAGAKPATAADKTEDVKAGQPTPEVGGKKAESPAATEVNEGEARPQEVERSGNGATQPAATPATTPPAPVPQGADAGNFPGGVKASPIARRMAEEMGIDLRQVRGTGPGGRIVKSDVESFQPGAAAPATAAPERVPAQPRPQPVAPTGEGITEEPVSKLRKRIATRMTESKQTVPHFYVTNEIDMGPALALRKEINEGLPEDQKVTINDLIVKAAALTLRQFPNLNSHYYGDKLVRHQHINIGIAVALEGGGLMNVVARDADSTSISRMAQHNKQMIAAARSGKVRPEDVEGSTFTVSNLGPYEVENFLAIINPPEAGILAVGSAREVPVVINGEIKVGNRMKCTLSADHRVSDGAEGAQFMQAFKKLLESPMRLLV